MRLAVVVTAVVLCCSSAPRPLASQQQDAGQWVAQAEEQFRAGRYRESIASYERGMQLRAPRAPESAWHIARAYARLGNAKQASRWLTHARELGFDVAASLAAEPELRAMTEAHGRRLRDVDTRRSCVTVCGGQVSRAT